MNVVSFHRDNKDIGLYRIKYLTKDKVQGRLGFAPEVVDEDDPSRMRYRWQFIYELHGEQYHCGVWDYVGTKQEEFLKLKKDFWFYGPIFVAIDIFSKERLDI